MGSVVKAVGDAVGVDLGGSGAKDQARTDADNATRRAEELLTDQYTIERGAYNPYNLAGVNALSDLAGNNFNFQADPGYQFRLNQGLTGINNAMAARGMGNSGRTLKALTDYNQNFASNEYGNAYGRNFNRLSTLAGLGFNAAQGLGGAARAYGHGMSDLQMGRANANAAAESAYQGRLSNLTGQLIQGGVTALTAGQGALPVGAGAGGATTQGGPGWMSRMSALSGLV
jgi:hypothetical protein